MPASRGSSTRATISNPSELDVVRALDAADFPCWSSEPLVNVLAERFGCVPRLVRPLLDALPIQIRISGAHLGRLDETWLFRAPGGGAPVADRLRGLDGILAWDVLDTQVIVRTWSQGAVEREKRLRGLHLQLGGRPLAQLYRTAPPPLPRKLNRADWALIAAMRATPWAPLEALAAAAGVTARVAKVRVPKLVAESVLVVEALPSTGLSHILVRVSPTSSAAAKQALAAFEDALVRSYVPEGDGASLVDALALAPTAQMRERALEVPGVASVEISARRASWHDDAAVTALVKQAMLSASA